MLIPEYAQLENIGYKYVLDSLSTASPFGAALAKKPRFYDKCEKDELLRELRNVNGVLATLNGIKLSAAVKAEPDNACQCDCCKPVADDVADDAPVAMPAASLDDAYSRLERLMMPLKDIRKSVERMDDAAFSEVEFFELKRFLLQVELIAPVFFEINARVRFDGVEVKPLTQALSILDLDNSRTATFYINDAKYPRLRDARKKKREVEEKLRRAETQIMRDALKAERSAFAAIEDEEEKSIRSELTEALCPYKQDILAAMDALGRLDYIIAKAKLAKKYGGVMPEITENNVVLDDMINPRIADSLAANGARFTPVSIALCMGSTVITGANMGGKSVALKTLALNVLLTLSGFMPFATTARVPMFDSVHMISEDLENIDRGLSSFGAEIVRFNEVMRERGELAMILLDEFARGTNPEEGARIVRAVTRHLNRQNAITVLTTHYDDVSRFSNAHYEVVGLRDMELAEVKRQIAALSAAHGTDSVAVIAKFMNYGLRPVTQESACPRDALNICRLLSLDAEILADIESEILK